METTITALNQTAAPNRVPQGLREEQAALATKTYAEALGGRDGEQAAAEAWATAKAAVKALGNSASDEALEAWRPEIVARAASGYYA